MLFGFVLINEVMKSKPDEQDYCLSYQHTDLYSWRDPKFFKPEHFILFRIPAIEGNLLDIDRANNSSETIFIVAYLIQTLPRSYRGATVQYLYLSFALRKLLR